MFANNRTNTKELYRAPQVINISSDGNSVTFENKIVSVGNVTSQTEIEPDVKFNVVGNTKIDGDTKVTGNTTVSGTINTNEIVIGSDYRLKSDIMTLNELFVVDNLRPVFYNKENCEKKEFGFIAHELQEYYPDLVNGIKDGENMQSVNYNSFIAILVNEIQMLKKRLSLLENQSKEK